MPQIIKDKKTGRRYVIIGKSAYEIKTDADVTDDDCSTNIKDIVKLLTSKKRKKTQAKQPAQQTLQKLPDKWDLQKLIALMRSILFIDQEKKAADNLPGPEKKIKEAEIEVAQKQLETIQKQIAEGKDQTEEQQKAILEQLNKITSQAEYLDELQKQLTEKQYENEDAKKLLEDKIEAIKDREIQLEQYEDFLAGRIANGDLQIQEQLDKIAEQETILREKQDDVNEYMASLGLIEEELKGYEQELADIKSLKTTTEEQNDRIKELTNLIEESDIERKDLQNEIKNSRNAVEQIRKIDEARIALVAFFNEAINKDNKNIGFDNAPPNIVITPDLVAKKIKGINPIKAGIDNPIYEVVPTSEQHIELLKNTYWNSTDPPPEINKPFKIPRGVKTDILFNEYASGLQNIEDKLAFLNKIPNPPAENLSKENISSSNPAGEPVPTEEIAIQTEPIPTENVTTQTPLTIPTETGTQTTEQTGVGKTQDFGGLSNVQIKEYLDKVPEFDGTFAADEVFPPAGTGTHGYIYNTLPANGRIGHWRAVLITPETIEHFDSYGDDPTDEWIDYYRDSGRQLKINKVKVQMDNSNDCGWFCIRFLLQRLNDIPFKTVTCFDKVQKMLNYTYKQKEAMAIFKKKFKEFKTI